MHILAQPQLKWPINTYKHNQPLSFVKIVCCQTNAKIYNFISIIHTIFIRNDKTNNI